MNKLIVFLVGMFLATSVFAGFLPGTEDIPALNDMVFSEDVTSFDVPEGQILILSGTTHKTLSEIEQFYKTNLTALGWSSTGKNEFKRGNDSLKLDIDSSSNQRTVKFNLTLSND